MHEQSHAVPTNPVLKTTAIHLHIDAESIPELIQKMKKALGDLAQVSVMTLSSDNVPSHGGTESVESAELAASRKKRAGKAPASGSGVAEGALTPGAGEDNGAGKPVGGNPGPAEAAVKAPGSMFTSVASQAPEKVDPFAAEPAAPALTLDAVKQEFRKVNDKFGLDGVNKILAEFGLTGENAMIKLLKPEQFAEAVRKIKATVG